VTTAETFINVYILIKRSFLFFEQHQMKCETKKNSYLNVRSVFEGWEEEWVGGICAGWATVAAVRDVICDGRVMTTG